MSLANGRPYLAIPGPSVMPETVLRAMHRSAPNIYTGELVDMVHGMVPDLKAVARTDHHVALYIANGHGAWEAALVNTLSRGDRVLVLATGRFCLGWGDMARMLGAEVDILDFGRHSPIDMDRVAEALAADPDHTIKAVLAVQVDTATSVRNDIAGLRRTLDAAGHPALVFSDNIACLAVDEFHMDAWGVDVMVTGSQKGLMTPPGMAFVYFNDRAQRARDSADMVTPYWDWRPRIDPSEFYRYFNGTAPTHHLYGLRAALDLIAAEGLEAVWRRHDRLARGVWAAFEAWGREGAAALNVADPAHRSRAVTTARLGPGDGDRLRDWLTREAGVTLGIPLGMGEGGAREDATGAYFRIGHMGHVNAHMVLGVLASIDTGLKSLGIAHGPGALDAAAAALVEG